MQLNLFNFSVKAGNHDLSSEFQAEKKEEGNKGATAKKRASAAQLRITKVIVFIMFRITLFMSQHLFQI